jgi:hypothetical protein
MVSIRIVADFGPQTCQTIRKLKRATTLEFTTIPAIIIHCWQLLFIVYVFKIFFDKKNKNKNQFQCPRIIFANEWIRNDGYSFFDLYLIYPSNNPKEILSKTFCTTTFNINGASVEKLVS